MPDDEVDDSKTEPLQNEDNDSSTVMGDLALDRIVDIIDFEVEHILWESMSRKAHFDSLEVSIVKWKSSIVDCL